MIDIPEPPWVTEAYDLLDRAEREERRRQCAAQGHDDTVDITKLGDPRPVEMCKRCGTTIEETP